MRKMIFITKSIDRNCIESGLTTTSSSTFEYGLLVGLSGHYEINIIHLGANEVKIVEIGSYRFSSINYRSIFGLFRLVRALVLNGKSQEVRLLTTGYYPVEIAAVLFSSVILRAKSFCYIYDTHRLATSSMPWLKRKLANAYFEMGFFLAKKNSGLLVLNDIFIKNRCIETPYLKTKVGINSVEKSCDLINVFKVRSRGQKKIFVFAGTMNLENGVGLLVDFLETNKSIDLEIHFYGDGECVANVQRLCAVDGRVKYFGRISNDALLTKLAEADFLINLRNPHGLTVEYSFPSKLVNFMSVGTPVISNRFPGLDEYYSEYIYLIDSYSVEAIAKGIEFLLDCDQVAGMGEAAKEFVYRENDWKKIAKEIFDFIG